LAKFISFFVMIVMLGAMQAVAQSASQKQALSETNSALEASKSRRTELGRDIMDMEKELSGLSVETSATARKMQNFEKEIIGIETQLQALEEDESKKRSAIKVRNKQISTLLGIMMRMSKAPEESVLVMPSGIKEKVQATRALGMITGNMKEEIESLSKELKQMDALHNAIATKRASLGKAQKTLENQRAALSKRIVKRRELMKSLHGETIEEQKRIASLVEKSHNLESLVGALEQERGKSSSASSKKAAEILRQKNLSVFPDKERSMIRSKSRSFVDAKGRVAFPVVGNIIRGFGHKRGENDTLRGIEINTSSLAQVIAPFDGEVVFVGPFLEYGQMVILRHSHQYHTLLAGFGAIDVEPGQFLLEGEPIGVMGRKGSSKRLYMELRKDGKAVNPRPWIASYNSHLARK